MDTKVDREKAHHHASEASALASWCDRSQLPEVDYHVGHLEKVARESLDEIDRLNTFIYVLEQNMKSNTKQGE